MQFVAELFCGIHLIRSLVDIPERSRGCHRLPSTCPAPEDIQSDYVRQNYQEHKHAGFYYELAFKDFTQPRGCKCITSNKTLTSPTTLRDDFSIQCAGQVYHADLSFDLKSNLEKKGTMIGSWYNFSLVKDVTFPNTIVDVGLRSQDRDECSLQYDWVIEFQCKDTQVLGHQFIEFYGLNFYSRTYDDGDVIMGEMLQAAVDRGLGDFLYTGLEVYRVDHTNCLQDH
jgi:hypothetical protein